MGPRWGLAFVLALTGCASYGTLRSDFVEGAMYDDPGVPHSLPRVYSGVAVDGWCLAMSFTPHEANGDITPMFCLVDLPMSLAVDTVLLPYKAYEQVKFGNYKPRFVLEVQLDRLRRMQQFDRIQLDGCRRDQDYPQLAVFCAGLLREHGPWAHSRVSEARIPP